jgi:CRP-like cAMP-binding protein
MIEPSTLQKHSFFGGLSPEQIALILPEMKQESYEPGTDIITEGQINDRIFFVLEGRGVAKKEGVRLVEFGEGHTFGEMEVLDVRPAEATITALSPMTVMYLSSHGLRDIYKNDIKIFSLLIMNLARELSRRLRYSNSVLTANSKS